MSSITADEQAKIQELVTNQTDYVDNTNDIRERKASEHLLVEIRNFEAFEKKNLQLKKDNFVEYVDKCKEICPYLNVHFNGIFNYLLKENVNYDIMAQFLYVLKMIEDGKMTQQDGSGAIGKILGQIYLDPAVQTKSAISSPSNEDSESVKAQPALEIGWKSYKKTKKI